MERVVAPDDIAALLERAERVRTGPPQLMATGLWFCGRLLITCSGDRALEEGVGMLFESARLGGDGVYAAHDLARLAVSGRLTAGEHLEAWWLVNWYAELGDPEAREWFTKMQTRNQER